MVIYFAIVFGFYFLLLLALWVGWRKAVNGKTKSKSKSKSIFISVVIAMRNEKQNLEKLLQSFSTQNYSQKDFEIIIVDDHSTDDSIKEVENWSAQLSSLTILSLNQNQTGKKAALTFGISQAKGEVIAMTDADCVLPKNWLGKIHEGFQDENTNMLVGAVALQDENQLFSQLQSLELASVIGTGMALAALGKPTMCNGANLSFRKKIFEQVNGYVGNEHIASGDDEFLMRKIQYNYPNSIHVLNPNESVVNTNPQASVRSFIQQRIRWASKWKINSSLFARLLAVFMVVVQISWLAIILMLILNKSMVIISIVGLKLTIDYIFLSNICHSLKIQFNFFVFGCLQFVYPIYVLFIGIFSQVMSHEWKGRAM
jgi:cellulose synthase/poly-beta-1,6-N-acetylglucosamine synthase-like glycosyltransferase